MDEYSLGVFYTLIFLILLMSVQSADQHRIHLRANMPTYSFELKSYTTLLESLSEAVQLVICF